MQETRTVTVGSVAKKSDVTNGRRWTRYSLLDSDDKFVGSTFDKHIADALDEYGGQLIEVDLEVKEGREGAKLYDLKAVRLATTGGANGNAPTPFAKHSTIVREVALKAAVAYAARLPGEAEATINEVLLVADKFVEWINDEKGRPEEEIPF